MAITNIKVFFMNYLAKGNVTVTVSPEATWIFGQLYHAFHPREFVLAYSEVSASTLMSPSRYVGFSISRVTDSVPLDTIFAFTWSKTQISPVSGCT